MSEDTGVKVDTGQAAPRGRRGPLQNRLLVWVLRSRLHRLVSGGHLVISYRGRRTGLETVIPVGYVEAGKELVVVAGRAAQKSWWRNFLEPYPLTVTHRGRTLAAAGTAIREGEPEAARLAELYFGRHPGRRGRIPHPVFVLIRPRREPAR